jgi:ankyrin repeat protein
VLTRASEVVIDAIRAHDSAAVRSLIDADPSQCECGGPGGETLVLFCVYVNAVDIASVVRGARPYDACEAAALGDLAQLNEALDRNADLISRRSSDGWTPLHLAGFFGRDDCAAFLIDNGAPLNAMSTNATRNTPLHAALAGNTNATLVRRLVFAGADVSARGETGLTPLHLAASRGDTVLCELFVARGADPQAHMDDGTTPGELATKRGHHELGEMLAKRKMVEID